MATHDGNCGAGIGSKTLNQAPNDLSSSKENMSIPSFLPKDTAQFFASVREAAAMLPTASPLAAFSQGFRDPAPVAKQAPSKQADLQVQAVDLSRECRRTSSSPRRSLERSPGSFESRAKDILAERLDSRLSRCVETFIGEHSRDVLDFQASASSRSEEAGRTCKSPSRSFDAAEGFVELVDVRVAELGQKLVGLLSEMLDSRVEPRLTALETQAAQRATNDNDVARLMGEEVCALGDQIQALNSRISKITSRPPVRVEHITALEERVIALDRSLSELRCEYLEGCLRHHQMEELVIALHSNIRDLRTTQTESKHGHPSDASNSGSSGRRPTANDLHAGGNGGATGASGLESFVSPRGRRQAKLETISEAPVDETVDSSPAEDVAVPQVVAAGKTPAKEESAGAEPETTEPNPAEAETPEFSTEGPGADRIMNECDALDSAKQSACERYAPKVEDIAPELAIEP